MQLRFPDLPRDLVPRLARALHQERKLDRAVLEGLLAHGATFGHLKPLLRGKDDNSLTQALRRLRRDGLFRTRLDPSTNTNHHEATEPGVAVYAGLIREETLSELAQILHDRQPLTVA